VSMSEPHSSRCRMGELLAPMKLIGSVVITTAPILFLRFLNPRMLRPSSSRPTSARRHFGWAGVCCMLRSWSPVEVPRRVSPHS
jgi:hypothetical protein